MTLFKTTIWQTLAIYTNTFNQSDRLDTFFRVVFIFIFIFFTIQRHGSSEIDAKVDVDNTWDIFITG